MGFSVTAAHVILFVALVGAASAATSAYWSTQTDLDESRRAQAQRLEEMTHTNLTIVGTPTHDGGTQYTFQVRNSGSTVLDISGFVYLLDGVLEPDVASATVSGAPGTDVLLPGETMTVVLDPVETAPVDLKVTAPNGVSTYHRGP